jgi:hypothetical protein
MAKVYSIDSENLSTLGTVTTRDLDPFGSSTNQSLGLFGGADISALYPYYLTLNPESYTASDFARVTLNKGISGSDFVTQTDSVFVRSDFRRTFNDTPIILEETTFDVSKKLFDDALLLSLTALNLTKPFDDLITNIGDKNYLHPQKTLKDLVENSFDRLEAKTFGKGLFDSQIAIDTIQSFDITKLLQDFANPIDLVAIPDGSTFQLNKTLRNTVDNIVDDISSFAIGKKLENDDTFGLDQTALHSHKPFADDQYLNDYSYFSLIKALFDDQVIDDVTNFVVGKSLFDDQVIDDVTYLTLDKPLSDLVDNVNDILQRIDFSKSITDLQSTDDAIQSFAVEKLLQDFANPVDLIAIPDGSTFQLNKTLRNTVLLSDIAKLVSYYNRSFDDISYTDDNDVLAFTKAAFDNQFLSDAIQSFSINKLLQEQPIVTDVTSFDVDKVLDVEFATPVERKYLTLDKTFADDLDTLPNLLIPLTQNIDLNAGSGYYDFSINEIGLIDFNSGAYSLDNRSSIFDTLVSVNIGKGLFDSQSSFDQIQSFTFNKVLEDFANPVDFVNIPDGSTFQLNKTLRNTVLPDDLASLVWYFKRSFEDSVSNISDLITYIALGKTPFDEQFVNDDLQSLRLDKALSELIVSNDVHAIALNKPFTESFSVTEFAQLSFNKSVIDFVNGSDQLEFLNVEKVLSDDQPFIDTIESFSITKLLQDFANPVDLVSIPDGSTFQLNKTLRNTVLLSDLASLVWYFNRSFDDTSNVTDYSIFDVTKSLNDNIVVSEVYSLLFDKSISDLIALVDTTSIDVSKNITDTQVVNDQSSLVTNKPVYEIVNLIDLKAITLLKVTSDLIENISDNETLSFNKGINDYEYALDNIESFSITKLLQDFANPVDFVGIPDGSTFQLNKTLRNTVSLSDTFNRYVEYNRTNDEYLTAPDSQTISVIKSFADSVNIFDEILRGQDINENTSDSTSVSELLEYSFNKSLHETAIVFETISQFINKPFSDDITSIFDVSLLHLNRGINNTLSTSDNDTYTLNKSFAEYFTSDSYNNLTSDQDYENQSLGDFDFNAGDASFDHETGNFSFANVIFDTLQSIDVNKFLEDFANPIDFVGIPDGSTFQLNKTLRNTVLPSDNLSRIANYIRDYEDNQSLVDDQTFETNKVLSESLLPSDLNQKILGKYFADFVSISDSTSVFRGGIQNPIDNTIITDDNVFALNKVINNSSVITDASTKSIVKTLRDFILVNDSTNIDQGGNDFTSNQGDLSNIEDSGYLFMTDYADITYFAEDYVGESRTFT